MKELPWRFAECWYISEEIRHIRQRERVLVAVDAHALQSKERSAPVPTADRGIIRLPSPRNHPSLSRPPNAASCSSRVLGFRRQGCIPMFLPPLFWIRGCVRQTQDRLWVATDGGAGAPDRRLMGSASIVTEAVGDDSMVVGKGIMIKGDVEDCAVRIDRPRGLSCCHRLCMTARARLSGKELGPLCARTVLALVSARGIFRAAPP